MPFFRVKQYFVSYMRLVTTYIHINMSSLYTKVALRKRKISHGRSSLYLDYYPAVYNNMTGKRTRREYLGMYLYDNPRESFQFKYNRQILYDAELIRCQRQISVIGGELGLDFNNGKDSFLEYFHSKMIRRNRYKTWHVAFDYFKNYCGGECAFRDLNVDYCQGFLDYLLGTSNRFKDKPIMPSTANNYMNKFRCVLRMAFKENRIKENLGGLVSNAKCQTSNREHLTLEELKSLSRTSCKSNVLKSASIFACLTGLRYSDVSRLKWENIESDSEGNWVMHIITKKTSTEAYLPIGEDALAQCGNRSSGIVFEGLSPAIIHKHLPDWLKQAGITKKITFHSFRHTYASLQLAAGTDLYTISKMLTHSNITTTQIYANVGSEQKREASRKIKLSM